MEYREKLSPLPMERCLRQEIVQLLNRLLPPERQIAYECLRTSEDGTTIFCADDAHLEAYARNGALLIKVDLDEQGRITGWKESADYRGYFEKGLRHGSGTEYSRSFHHIGEARLAGRWEHNQFVEGTIHKALLIKDETAPDGYVVEVSEDDFPLQLCMEEARFFIREMIPDECESLYISDLHLHDGVLDIIGSPKAFCRKLGGAGTDICVDCPKDEAE